MNLISNLVLVLNKTALSLQYVGRHHTISRKSLDYVDQLMLMMLAQGLDLTFSRLFNTTVRVCIHHLNIRNMTMTKCFI